MTMPLKRVLGVVAESSKMVVVVVVVAVAVASSPQGTLWWR